MKIVTKKILSLSILPSIVLFNGCSTHKSSQLVDISDIHPYNENFGVIPNPEVDNILKEEILAEKEPTEIEIPQSNDPNVYVGLKYDPEAVTAENYTETPPIITYKYRFDPKFYTANELKKQ